MPPHGRHTSDDVTLNWLPFDHVVPLLTYHMADVYLSRAAVQLPTSEARAAHRTARRHHTRHTRHT